jgi:hypothetical protein
MLTNKIGDIESRLAGQSGADCRCREHAHPPGWLHPLRARKEEELCSQLPLVDRYGIGDKSAFSLFVFVNSVRLRTHHTALAPVSEEQEAEQGHTNNATAL